MKNYLLKFNASALLLLLFTISAAANDARETEPRYADLPNFHRVNARLYRGAQPKEGGIEHLRKLGVDTIINLRDDDARAERERAQAIAAGMKFFNVPLAGRSRPQDSDIDKILRLINDPSNGVVFVHCKYGKDRTGTVIACYRILNESWTSACAKREAKHYGMSIFQFGMKRYIRSFYEEHAKPSDTHGRPHDCPPMPVPLPASAT